MGMLVEVERQARQEAKRKVARPRMKKMNSVNRSLSGCSGRKK